MTGLILSTKERKGERGRERGGRRESGKWRADSLHAAVVEEHAVCTRPTVDEKLSPNG